MRRRRGRGSEGASGGVRKARADPPARRRGPGRPHV